MVHWKIDTVSIYSFISEFVNEGFAFYTIIFLRKHIIMPVLQEKANHFHALFQTAYLIQKNFFSLISKYL